MVSPHMEAPITNGASGPAIEIRGLRKSYGDSEVLTGVSLSVAPGEVVAIIGPSGSGKSTLIRCMNLLETPTGGELHVLGRKAWAEGQTPSKAELRALRREVGMVFQSFNLFPHMTALENVSLAQIQSLGKSRMEADEKSRGLLEQVGLGHRMDHRPGHLSGGQQQRVAIARALALEPSVMLFDEPTSAIDPELRVEVLRTMKDVAAAGMTMLVVTHELSFAERVADKVVFIADGQILESGRPQQILHAPEHPRLRRFLAAVGEEEL